MLVKACFSFLFFFSRVRYVTKLSKKGEKIMWCVYLAFCSPELKSVILSMALMLYGLY